MSHIISQTNNRAAYVRHAPSKSSIRSMSLSEPRLCDTVPPPLTLKYDTPAPVPLSSFPPGRPDAVPTELADDVDKALPLDCFVRGGVTPLSGTCACCFSCCCFSRCLRSFFSRFFSLRVFRGVFPRWNIGVAIFADSFTFSLTPLSVSLCDIELPEPRDKEFVGEGSGEA